MRIGSKQIVKQIQVLNPIMSPTVGDISDHFPVVCIYSTVNS